ncbi:AAA family ATPase, partial [Bacteroides heparinolyticus]
MDEKMQALRKYNLWDSGSFDFGYERSGYTDKIAAYTGNRLIKVLVGQRRAGKSYLLRQVARRLVKDGVKAENTLIINRELSDFNFLATYKDLDDLLKLYKSELRP